MPTLDVTYNSQKIINGITVTAPVNVTYNGSSITSVSEGSTKTLNCNGKVMASNVVIGTKTLQCSNKLMASNIVIKVNADEWDYPVQTGDTLLIKQAYEITQNGDIVILDSDIQPATYTVTLSGISSYGFESTSTPTNPDSTLYDGVYRSTNYHVGSTKGAMRIDFSNAPVFNIYIRSYAESNYDYIIASTLDASAYPTSYSGSNVKAHTRGNQQSGTSISSYTKVSYENDGGQHHIFITYVKDGSVDSNDDRGYVLIEK